jgi:hypothetical protein
MRLVFHNLARPKKSAKAVAHRVGLPLSLIQNAVARICGYCDWHDLEENHAKGSAFELDQYLDHSDFIERHTRLSLALADELDIPDGDAQYVLAGSRLTGDRPVSLSDQIELRLNCWHKTILREAPKRSRGAIGTIRSPGRTGEAVILRSSGRPTTVITHTNVLTIADFEYVSPRNPAPMFLPMRLYLPYGYWIEDDGARVLFARDYKPMWRIRDGLAPERLEPSLWIKWRDQFHIWDAHTPWASSELKRNLEALLTSFGIRTLPVWADALPLLVHNDNLQNFSDAIEPLKQCRSGGWRTVA